MKFLAVKRDFNCIITFKLYLHNERRRLSKGVSEVRIEKAERTLQNTAEEKQPERGVRGVLEGYADATHGSK